MITTLKAKNFEGIESAELQLGQVTAVYGENGSAKSSLADAIVHALTGDALRGGSLAELVRQGSKSMEVEVALDGGPTIGRRRTKSGTGEVSVQGVVVKSADIEAAVRKALGVGPSTLRAALQAGNILELEPAKLQALLVALTGAKLDGGAIQKAFEAAVVQAATRTGLSLPGVLDDFASCEKIAEGARVAAKRALKEREADLERTPPGALGVAGSHEQLVANLNAIGKRRDKARHDAAKGSGAAEERVRSLKEKLAALPVLEKPAGDGAGYQAAAAELARLREQAQGTVAQLHVDTARLEEARAATAGGEKDYELLAGAAALEQELQAAQQELEVARAELGKVTDEGKRQKALIDQLPKAGCVGPCPVLPETTCPLKDLGPLAEKLKAAREETIKKFRAAETRVAEAEAKVAGFGPQLEAVAQAQGRVKALGRVDGLEKLVASAKQEAEKLGRESLALAPEVEQLEAQRAAWEKWSARQELREELTTALAAAERAAAKPGDVEDLAVVEAELAKAQAAMQAFDQGQRRAAAEAAVKKASQAVEDADTVAKACGPGGVKTALLAKAVAPFSDAANAALALLAPGYELVVDDAFSLMVRKGTATLRPAQLSDGERTRLLYVLQFAVAKLAGVKLLILDRGEQLDAGGKAALKTLVGTAVSEGFQVLMLSCAAPPASAPQGLSVYVMAAGRSRQIAAAAAAA